MMLPFFWTHFYSHVIWLQIFDPHLQNYTVNIHPYFIFTLVFIQTKWKQYKNFLDREPKSGVKRNWLFQVTWPHDVVTEEPVRFRCNWWIVIWFGLWAYKYLLLCWSHMWKSYEFGITWEWENYKFSVAWGNA